MIRTCLLMTCIVCTIVLKSIRVIDDVISVNQSQTPDGDNKHKEFSRQPLRPPPPPLEVAPYRPYRSLKRVWKNHFTDGLEASDIPIMRSHARRLVHCKL